MFACQNRFVFVFVEADVDQFHAFENPMKKFDASSHLEGSFEGQLIGIVVVVVVDFWV